MMKMLLGSKLRHPTHTRFEGEDSDEKILYIFRRSFVTNFDWMAVALLLLTVPFVVDIILLQANNATRAAISPFFIFVVHVFWYIFAFGFIFQNFINWFFNVYVVTTKKIIDIDVVGFLYKNVSEASILNIEDVTSNISGAKRMIFNYGDVMIQTAAETKEFEFADVANPNKVRDIISDIATAAKHGGDVYDK